MKEQNFELHENRRAFLMFFLRSLILYIDPPLTFNPNIHLSGTHLLHAIPFFFMLGFYLSDPMYLSLLLLDFIPSELPAVLATYKYTLLVFSFIRFHIIHAVEIFKKRKCKVLTSCLRQTSRNYTSYASNEEIHN